MCQKCAKNPEWCERVKEEFENRREEFTDALTKSFSKLLTALENKDHFTVTKEALELQFALGTCAETLSLAYHKEFILKAAQEIAKEDEN